MLNADDILTIARKCYCCLLIQFMIIVIKINVSHIMVMMLMFLRKKIKKAKSNDVVEEGKKVLQNHSMHSNLCRHFWVGKKWKCYNLTTIF